MSVMQKKVNKYSRKVGEVQEAAVKRNHKVAVYRAFIGKLITDGRITKEEVLQFNPLLK